MGTSDLYGHLSIRDSTLAFLSDRLIFAYQKPHHRINKIQQWYLSNVKDANKLIIVFYLPECITLYNYCHNNK